MHNVLDLNYGSFCGTNHYKGLIKTSINTRFVIIYLYYFVVILFRLFEIQRAWLIGSRHRIVHCIKIPSIAHQIGTRKPVQFSRFLKIVDPLEISTEDVTPMMRTHAPWQIINRLCFLFIRLSRYFVFFCFFFFKRIGHFLYIYIFQTSKIISVTRHFVCLVFLLLPNRLILFWLEFYARRLSPQINVFNLIVKNLALIFSNALHIFTQLSFFFFLTASRLKLSNLCVSLNVPFSELGLLSSRHQFVIKAIIDFIISAGLHIWKTLASPVIYL